MQTRRSYLVWLHLSRRRRIANGMCLRSRNSGVTLARRPEYRQFGHNPNAFWRTQARNGIPSRSSIVSDDIYGVIRCIILNGRVRSAGDVVERIDVVRCVLPDFVQGGIDKAVVVAGGLVVDGCDCRPLRRSGASTAKSIPAGWNAWYVEIRKNAT